MFVEKFIHNDFWRNIRHFDFCCFGSFSRNIRSFLSLELKSSFSQNSRRFFRVGAFIFSSSESYFLKYRELCCCFLGFCFLKYKNSFLLLKYKKFFSLRVRKFHFLKYKDFFWAVFFFFFFELRPKSALGSYTVYYYEASKHSLHLIIY